MIMSKNSRLIALLMAMTLLVAMATGCGKSDSTAGKAKEILTVATAYDAKSLDPHATNDVASSNVMAQIYENLVALNDKGEVVPMLAESFKRLDPLTYEFKLKKGVKFHNGEELKASDVKFSLERALSPLGASIAHIVGEIDPAGFKIVDDYTIIVKTKTPFAGFLPSLAHTGGSILNEKAVKAAGKDYSQQPVGTGPFKFTKWAKGDRVELERFDDFHGSKPQFKNMVIRVIVEPTNRAIELESGSVDIAYEISTNDLKRIQENKDLKLLRIMDNSITHLGMNTTKKPFDDVRVRQAISYAVDSKLVVDTVWRGIGTAAVGPIPTNVKYSNKSLKSHEYNPEKAKQLLAEAGLPNGFKTTIWTNDKKERIDMATIIQNELKQVGIIVDIKVMEWGAFLDGTNKGEQEMYMIGWNSQINDPDMSLYAMFHSSKFGAGGNRPFYKNSKVDGLIEQGRQMPDSEARQTLYYELQDMINADAPWIYLNAGEQVVGTKKTIKGFVPSPFGYHVLYNVSFDGQ